MGIKERRENEKEEMRKIIMDAAVEIVNNEGYENLSIRKIAARIEYSATTIYLYYKNKADIISDMSQVLYKKIEENIRASLTEEPLLAPDERMRLILLSFIHILTNEAEMTKAITYSGISEIFTNESSDIPTNPAIELGNEIIDEGISQGIFKPRVKNTAWMLASALLGVVMTMVENNLPKLDNFDQLADSFADLMIGGLKQ